MMFERRLYLWLDCPNMVAMLCFALLWMSIVCSVLVLMW